MPQFSELGTPELLRRRAISKSTPINRSSRPLERGFRVFPAGVGAVQRHCGPSCGCLACRSDKTDRASTTQRILALQRLIGNRATAQLMAAGAVKTVIGGSGEELDPTMRSSMEQRFGADFSEVRVHRDSQAAASANALSAHAYTAGNHIVFAQGRYNPSSEGQRILAHELAHVVQQRSGPVSGVPIGDGISVSEPGDYFERAAENKANEVMNSSPPKLEEGSGETGSQSGTPISVERLAIQRDDDSASDGTNGSTVEQIATDEDIAYLEDIVQTGLQAGPDQVQDQNTAQALWVQPLTLQRWSVWTCFGDKANIAAAVGAIGVSVAGLLAPDPTTLTKIAGVAGIISGIAWLISAIIGLRNCYKAQDDAAQHQREIDSLQRQIDQLQRTLQQVQGGGAQ